MSLLKLYVDSQYSSPYAMCVFVALMEKGLSFDISTVDLGTSENKKSDYADTSLTSRVPTLVHGDFSLSESSAIVEYIDEVFPGVSLYPNNIQDKARARQIQAWLRSDLMPIRQERSTEVIFYKPSTAPLSAEAQEAAKKLFFVANNLLKENHKHLFGQWSIADVDLSLMLNRLILNGDNVPDRLVSYAEHQWQRPSIQAWVNKSRSLD